MLTEALQDARYGLRLLRRSPAFTLVALLSLALGIGANTAIFTLVDAVLARTLPVARPHELVLLAHSPGSRPTTVFSVEDLRAFRGHTDVLSDLAAFRPWNLNARVGGAGESQSVAGQFVTGRYYTLLGLRASIGRLLTDEDDRVGGGQAVAVISHGYWKRQFGGDPAIVGRQIALQSQPFTIVGVTPPEFFGTEPGRPIEVTVPLAMLPVVNPGPMANPRTRWLRAIGRLAPGVSAATAQAKLAVIWEQARRDAAAARPPAAGPAAGSGRALEADPLVLLDGGRGVHELRQRFSLPLQVLMATVGLVLLLACANLASLLLARASARRHEVGLRAALGAGRGRLLRQMITESLLLSAIGGAAGVVIAGWCLRLLLAMMSWGGGNPIVLDLSATPRTVLFTLAISLATALVFGVVPALNATRVDLSSGLRQHASTIAGGRSPWMPIMVGVQTALCLLLLSGAVLFLRTLVNLRHVEGGFRDEPVLFVSVRSSSNTEAGLRTSAIFRDLQSRLQQIPGVSAATLSMDTPANGLSWGEGLSVPGRAPEPGDKETVWVNHVGPRFFETLGIPLIAGRDLRADDDERAPAVVVLGERLARHYFGTQDPIGQFVISRETRAQVVGVAKDVKYGSLRGEATEMLYRPYLQRPAGAANARDWRLSELGFALRTTRAPAAIGEELRRILHDTASGLELARLRRLDEQIDAALARERMVATLSACFGIVALLLACIGLYGTLASVVARRTPEIGVRLALGATRGAVAWMVVRRALVPVSVGLAIGLAAVFAAGSLVHTLLYGLTPTDPASHAGAIAILLACAACAAFIPARRAARIDPMTALRRD